MEPFISKFEDRKSIVESKLTQFKTNCVSIAPIVNLVAFSSESKLFIYVFKQFKLENRAMGESVYFY